MNENRFKILHDPRKKQQDHPDDGRLERNSQSRILDATMELVLSLGWAGLTIDAIAGRARVGKQTIYRWWSSKGAVLFDAVIGDGYDWPGVPDTGDFKADIVSAMRNLVSEFSEPSFTTLMRALLAGAQDDPGLARRLDGQLSRVPIGEFEWRIVSAQASGQADQSADPGLVAEMAYGAIFRRWMLGGGELDFGFADAVANALIRAVTPARGDRESGLERPEISPAAAPGSEQSWVSDPRSSSRGRGR